MKQKSHLIKVIHAWFAALFWLNELIIIIITEITIFNIKKRILYNIINIFIENENEMKMMMMSDKKIKEWENHHYFIINEINMINCKIIT